MFKYLIGISTVLCSTIAFAGVFGGGHPGGNKPRIYYTNGAWSFCSTSTNIDLRPGMVSSDILHVQEFSPLQPLLYYGKVQTSSIPQGATISVTSDDLEISPVTLNSDGSFKIEITNWSDLDLESEPNFNVKYQEPNKNPREQQVNFRISDEEIYESVRFINPNGGMGAMNTDFSYIYPKDEYDGYPEVSISSDQMTDPNPFSPTKSVKFLVSRTQLSPGQYVMAKVWAGDSSYPVISTSSMQVKESANHELYIEMTIAKFQSFFDSVMPDIIIGNNIQAAIRLYNSEGQTFKSPYNDDLDVYSDFMLTQ